MPTISMFYGIIIRMYFAPNEHNPPHFHAYFQNERAIVNINTCEIISSSMSKKHNKMLEVWADLHNAELLANWELCMNGENPYPIKPLE